MKRSDVLIRARLAGEVVRYHTWPMLTRQTVAGHSWHVLRIYWQIFGAPAPEVATYIIWHDAGELKTGDPPFPVKAQNPVLKAEYDRLEHCAVVAMGGPDLGALGLSACERVRVKVADLLDMYEHGLHELALGNTYAQPIVEDTHTAVSKLLPDLPVSDRARVEAYVSPIGVR